MRAYLAWLRELLRARSGAAVGTRRVPPPRRAPHAQRPELGPPAHMEPRRGTCWRADQSVRVQHGRRIRGSPDTAGPAGPVLPAGRRDTLGDLADPDQANRQRRGHGAVDGGELASERMAGYQRRESEAGGRADPRASRDWRASGAVRVR